jgi:hypothetical protein
MRWRLLISIFAISALAQILMIHFWAGRSFNGYAYNPLVVYLPFVNLVEPAVRRHYGGGDGSLGPVLMWGCGLGVAVYSAGLTYAITWISHARTRKPNV